MRDNEKTREELIQELNDAEERFTSLFEGSGDSILIVDVETSHILDVNSNFVRRMGYNRNEILKMTFEDIEVLPDTRNALSWISSYSGTRVYECEIRRKDGSLMPVEISSRLTQHHKRAVYQNSIRDISIRKQAEQERLELNMEKERTQLLASFITQTSHEFRTPLSIMRSSTYLLKKSDNPETQQQQIEQIEEQIASITTLVDALNSMAKLDRVREIPTKQTDLSAIIRTLADKWQNNLTNSGFELDVNLPLQSILVLASTGFITQAIEAIIENAVKFTDEPGKIVMQVMRHDDRSAIIEIQDSGMGIDEEHIPRIFERFYRVDEARTMRGFGLGLSIANRIVELHQGNISVESKPGEGSIFTIILPISQET